MDDLSSRFAGFRATLGGEVTAPGVGAAYATIRRRRQTRAVVGGTAAVVAILLPAGALATGGHVPARTYAPGDGGPSSCAAWSPLDSSTPWDPSQSATPWDPSQSATPWASASPGYACYVFTSLCPSLSPRYPSSPSTPSSSATLPDPYLSASAGASGSPDDSCYIAMATPLGGTDISVSATDLTFDPPVNGVRHGTLTVTVRNSGAETLTVSLVLARPQGIVDATTAPTSWAVAPGQTRVIALSMVTSGAATAGQTIRIAIPVPNDSTPADNITTVGVVYH